MILAAKHHYGSRGEFYRTPLLESAEISRRGERWWSLQHHNDHCKGVQLRCKALQMVGNRATIIVIWSLAIHNVLLPLCREDVVELLCDIGWLEEEA